MGIRKRVFVVLSIAGGMALVASVVFAQLGPDEVRVPSDPITALECDSGVTHDFFEVWSPSQVTNHYGLPVEAVAAYLRAAPAFEDASEHAQEYRPAPEQPVETPSPRETGDGGMNPSAYLYPTVTMVHMTDSRVDSVVDVQNFEGSWTPISATTCDSLIAQWRSE
jgi:hypothetical protein